MLVNISPNNDKCVTELRTNKMDICTFFSNICVDPFVIEAYKGILSDIDIRSLDHSEYNSIKLFIYVVKVVGKRVRRCDGNTLLHDAVTSNISELHVKFIINEGFDNLFGMTPLMLSIIYGFKCNILYSKSDIDIFDMYGRTALHYAVFYNDKNVYDMINRSKNILHQDNLGQNILYVSVLLNRYDIVKYLKSTKYFDELCNAVSREDKTAVELSLYKNDLDMFKLIVDGKDFDIRHYIKLAIYNDNDVSFVQYLLECSRVE
jgi:hypothetical protein